MLLQQGGTLPHWKSINCKDSLDETFSGRWIGRVGPIAGPPKSPDLTRCDFFVWGFIKDRVYRMNVLNIQERKIWISDSFTQIIDEMRRKV